MLPFYNGIVNRLALLLIWVLCFGASVIALSWMLTAIIAGSKRAWTLAVAFDQLANATTGGSEDRTISSRASESKETTKWACILCKLLDRIDPNHCENSKGL